MEASFVITLDWFDEGRTSFQQHYCLATYNTNFGGQDFYVDWNDFYNCINSFSSVNGIPENEIGLRFVHCYNSGNNELYLRMQICALLATEITNHGRAVLELDTTSAVWYELKQGTVSPSATTTLYDSDYLNYFYYSIDPLPEEGGLENLVADTSAMVYVRNLVFPYSQLKQMYTDNSSPSGAKLHFAACSYTEAIEGDTAIEWPHTLVIYLANSGNTPLLNNTSNPTDVFENKGADMATLCPPNCGASIDSSAY